MQKFLRISPPPISSSLLLSSSSFSLPNNCSNNSKNPLFKPRKPFLQLGFALMHTTCYAPFQSPCLGYYKPNTTPSSPTQFRVLNSTITFQPVKTSFPVRVLKEFKRGFCTEVGKGKNGVLEENEGENESESEDNDEESCENGENGESEKRGKIIRRRRSCGDVMAAGNPDLLTIPGIGPRNLRKLVDKGIVAVSELKQLYRDKFFGKSSQNMVEYLQSSVGIIHRNHAESITVYIKKSVDEELKEDGPNISINPHKNRVTLCVEGNISVGKTTFLRRIAGETLELRDLVEIVPEPVDKWQDIGADHFNILDAFYEDPKRYAYTFQNYVFVTRVMQERDSSAGIEPLRLMERSVFSDRMVFVRAVHEAKWMSEMEISIYDSWFDPVVSCLPGLIPDGFIYLRATPDTCHKRMMIRKRAEEGGVSLDYLRDLHEKHESWFTPSESINPGVLSVSRPPFQLDNSLHPDIRDRVYFLEGPQMHSSLQKVPALILDCDPDIDFNRDVEAKSHYARQVAEFFQFVKKGKESQPPKPSDGPGKDGRPQIILPQNGGLWVPDRHFPNSPLPSLDFRRAMSAV